MEVTAEHLGDSTFGVAARGHRLISDQPRDNGGHDSGMSPPEPLLASLATCAVYYATRYLKARNLPAKGLKVNVTAEKGQKPARLASFKIEVVVPGLDDQHGVAVLRAVKSCLIHNTLLNQPSIEVLLNTDARAPVEDHSTAGR